MHKVFKIEIGMWVGVGSVQGRSRALASGRATMLCLLSWPDVPRHLLGRQSVDRRIHSQALFRIREQLCQ
jgi:hypothetical protein